MKRLAMIFVLSSSLITGSAMAGHDGRDLLSRENIGGAIGAAIGGLAGNKIVDGKGQPAATAAGAVGGFLIGRNIAHNYRGDTYAPPRYSTGYGRTGTYQPRRVYKQHRSYKPASGYKQRSGYKHRGCCDHDKGYRHHVHPMHETYVATCKSNVRAGPSTRYHVVDQLYDGESVYVIGKVKGRNWYQVRVGHREGYVYAPLLRPSRYGYSGNKTRAGWYR